MLDCYKNRYRLQTSNLTTAYHVRAIGTKNETVGMNFSLDVLKMCILFLKSKQALYRESYACIYRESVTHPLELQNPPPVCLLESGKQNKNTHTSSGTQSVKQATAITEQSSNRCYAVGAGKIENILVKTKKTHKIVTKQNHVIVS